MTNTGITTPTTPLSEAMKQSLRTKLLARGVATELVEQWLDSAGSVGELTQWLIAWCRQTQAEN